MNDYYVAKPGSQQPMGPMSIDQIRMGMQQGTITPDCVYCTTSMPQWQPLSSLPGLMPAAAPTPAPMPMGGGMPMGAPMPGVMPGQAGMPMAKPDNYMVWSILVTILCCLIGGVVAIVKSSSVNTLWAQGRFAEAKQAADSAKQWCIISAVIGLVLGVIQIAVAASGM